MNKNYKTSEKKYVHYSSKLDKLKTEKKSLENNRTQLSEKQINKLSRVD